MVSFQNLIGPRLIKRGFNKALFRVEEVQQNNNKNKNNKNNNSKKQEENKHDFKAHLASWSELELARV